MVGDTVAQTLASGDFFGEMAFASTCHKVLKGADEAASSDSVKRSCDVLAIGSTRCLELSVKDFLGVLQDLVAALLFAQLRTLLPSLTSEGRP